jgi:hypothetical protein
MGFRSAEDRDRVDDQGEPVSLLGPEPADQAPESGMALSLSGGGYRAMVFHLGALWRLNDAGLLGRLDRISSVSGGSITAACLARHSPKLGLSAGASSPSATRRCAPISILTSPGRQTSLIPSQGCERGCDRNPAPKCPNRRVDGLRGKARSRRW